VEYILLLAIALVVAVFGIRMGMLLAPRIERLADRATPTGETADPATGPPAEPPADAAPEPHHEDTDDRTD
jgi:hypothetical protein